MLARFFHSAGFNLGERLLGAGPGNDFGHFEDLEVLELHQDILWRESGEDVFVVNRARWTRADQRRAEALVNARRDRALWGWKDPRGALFLDMWDQVTPDARVVCAVRHPMAVVHSLHRRHATDPRRSTWHDRFLRAWLIHTWHCLQFAATRRTRCAIVIVEALVRSPQRVLDAATRRLGLSIDAHGFSQTYEPGALTQGLAAETLAVSAQWHAAALSLYRVCCAIAAR